MTYCEWLEGFGVAIGPQRTWPIEWINYRMHPSPYWPAVDMYREMMRNKEHIEPVVLCEHCYVVLDGWHRMAAYWLEGVRTVPVRLASEHYPLWEEESCRVDKIYHIESLAPYTELPYVSGAFRQEDMTDYPGFHRLVQALQESNTRRGVQMPMMRYWEQAKAIAYLGFVHDRTVLDVGTRESTVPEFLAEQGALVTACDIDPLFVVNRDGHPNVTYEIADARALPYLDDTFDCVISTACIKHIPGWGDRKAVKEMLRVVKPHGLVALSFDFGPTYEAYPSSFSGRRIYDEKTAMSRLAQAEVVGPISWAVNWDASKDAWPIKHQSREIWDMGYNLQVGFLLMRKA